MWCVMERRDRVCLPTPEGTHQSICAYCVCIQTLNTANYPILRKCSFACSADMPKVARPSALHIQTANLLPASFVSVKLENDMTCSELEKEKVSTSRYGFKSKKNLSKTWNWTSPKLGCAGKLSTTLLKRSLSELVLISVLLLKRDRFLETGIVPANKNPIHRTCLSFLLSHCHPVASA